MFIKMSITITSVMDTSEYRQDIKPWAIIWRHAPSHVPKRRILFQKLYLATSRDTTKLHEYFWGGFLHKLQRIDNILCQIWSTSWDKSKLVSHDVRELGLKITHFNWH
jgi:hypothetical protein